MLKIFYIVVCLARTTPIATPCTCAVLTPAPNRSEGKSKPRRMLPIEESKATGGCFDRREGMRKPERRLRGNEQGEGRGGRFCSLAEASMKANMYLSL
jgi:hypothetical protein